MQISFKSNLVKHHNKIMNFPGDVHIPARGGRLSAGVLTVPGAVREIVHGGFLPLEKLAMSTNTAQSTRRKNLAIDARK